MKKIQAFSKLTSVNIVPKNAIDAAKDYQRPRLKTSPFMAGMKSVSIS